MPPATPLRSRFALAWTLIAAALLTRPMTASAAQEPNPSGAPAVELKVVGGYAGFIDEDMIDHFVGGGALRFRLTPRLSAEAELVFMRGPCDDRDIVVVPTLAWDLRRGGAIVPFVVGGAGWLRNTNAVGTGLYSSSSWTGGGGAGVRIRLSAATTLTVEGRIGTEPAVRLTAALGIALK